MCRSSPYWKLLVSTVVPLGKIVVFSVKNTVRGSSFIFLWQCYGGPLIVWWQHTYFITLSYGWSRQLLIISHYMVCLLNDIWIIGYMVKVIISLSVYFCCWTLMISILIKPNILCPLSLASVSTLILFPASLFICNHMSAWVLMFLNWL